MRQDKNVPARNDLMEFLLYQGEDGRIRIETRLHGETVWLTQEQMATLFGKAKSTINEHIKNIFAEGELVEESVVKKFGISEFQQKAPNYTRRRQGSKRRARGLLCGGTAGKTMK